MATTIGLGITNNGETQIPDKGKVNFKNNETVAITLTTQQGINPPGTTDIAVGATSSDFTVSGNKNAVLDYSWVDTGSMKRSPRTGTIKVT